ncbi:MAG TPA: hypothetical protein VMW01_11000 [Williamwhitmania sp.]|nr:hypothetical protein [Williamwhitmania sp.]
MKNIMLAAVVIGSFFMTACDPNKDIYNKLDAYNDAHPYNTTITYTLTTADYGTTMLHNATINQYKAFNDTLEAKNFIPIILATNFKALNFGSSASVTYNYMPSHPSYLDAMFGYQLTTADYNSFGDATISANQSFTSATPAKLSTAFVPGFLLTKYPSAVANDTVNVLLNFNFAESFERYKFNGTAWSRVSYTTDYTAYGYELQSADYLSIGGVPAANKYFTSTAIPANYLPQFLKMKYPYLPAGTQRIVKFKYGNLSTNMIQQYTFDGSAWNVTPTTITKTDPYIYGPDGWSFDPTVHFTTNAAAMQKLVDYVYATYGAQYGSSYGNDEFYYGASAHYNNFDLRLSTRATYSIPGFETGTDAEKIALTWSRLQEGLAILLNQNFPAAVPEVNGIKVYYWVTFNTYENNLSKNTYIGIFSVDNSTGSPVFSRDTDMEDAQVLDGALLPAQVGWNR